MTGALSSNAPLPPLNPFSCNDDEDTYRPPQLRRVGVDAAAPELRALLGEDALDEDITRPNRLGPERTVVLVEGEDLYEPLDKEIIAEGAVNLEEVVLPEIPALPSARVTHG